MFEINCDILNFTFEHHVNIITGESALGFKSGTHKTHLFSALEAQYSINRLYSNKELLFVDNINILSKYEFSAAQCIIIDEINFAPNELELIMQRIRTASGYVIVIGRMLVKQLEYSVDAIYKVDFDGKIFKLSKQFVNSSINNIIPDVIVCEDATTVASIYSEVLDTDVIAARGRGNFYKYVRRNNSAFIIADKPKFGANLLDLIYCIFSKKDNIDTLILFLPYCFEEILCNIVGIDNKEFDSFDLEEHYEQLIKQLSLWNKSSVIQSINRIRTNYDISTSTILQEMQKFYSGEYIDSTRCYVLKLTNITDYGYFDYIKMRKTFDSQSTKDISKDSHHEIFKINVF